MSATSDDPLNDDNPLLYQPGEEGFDDNYSPFGEDDTGSISDDGADIVQMFPGGAGAVLDNSGIQSAADRSRFSQAFHEERFVFTDRASEIDLLEVMERSEGPEEGINAPATKGWRGLLYRAFRENYYIAPSEEEKRERRNERRKAAQEKARKRMRHDVAREKNINDDLGVNVLITSPKGGVGKTSTCVSLAQTFARYSRPRSDGRETLVAVIDSNTDMGTIEDRFPRVRGNSTPRNLLELVRDQNLVRSGELKVRQCLDRTQYKRVHLLRNDSDFGRRAQTDAQDIRVISDLLSDEYAISLFDGGTGLARGVTRGTMEVANSIVIVLEDGPEAKSQLEKTTQYLNADSRMMGGKSIRSRCIALVVCRTPNEVSQALMEELRQVVRRVVSVPYEPNLAQNKTIDVRKLSPEYQDAILLLANEATKDLVKAQS